MFLLFFIANAAMVVNIQFLNSQIFGGVFLALYLLLHGYLAGRLMGKFLLIEEWILRLFIGALAVFIAIATLSGLFIIFSELDDNVLSAVVFLVGFALTVVSASVFPQPAKFLNALLKDVKRVLKHLKTKTASLQVSSIKTPIFIAVSLLFGIGFYTLLSLGSPKAYIRSPWDIIPDQFILIIIFLSAFLLYKIIAKPKKFLLVPIILFSLLQHLYIPAVYRLPYGGDTWRHTASMMQIEDNGFLAPSSYDIFSIGPFTVPSTTLTVSSYASFWASGIFLNRALHIDLVTLMTWWQYLLFSAALPILFFVLFKHIFSNSRSAPLLGAFLPSLFFPMQAYGAVSLPVGFGFLSFTLFLTALIVWLKHKTRLHLAALLLFWGALIPQYMVYWIFATLLLGFFIIMKYTESRAHLAFRSRLARIVYIIASIAFIPAVSLLVSPNAKLDILTTGADYAWDFWKHAFLYVFGLKGMEGYYLHTGNLVWHSMRDAFIAFPPFSWDYFDTVLFFCFTVILAVSVARRSKSSVTALFLYVLFAGLMSIFLDRYYIGGIHLLTERLDLIVITSFIFFLIGGYERIVSTHRNGRVLIASLIALTSLAVGSAYASGPIHGRVTKSHYSAMQALYADMKKTNRTDYCVLSEHFPLAGLEASSRGRVKNGNFPIRYGYLEEGGKIFIKMFSRPDVRWMKEAAQTSNTRGCYLILDKRFLADWNKTQIRWILGREVIEVDDVHIWRYDTSVL
ncbi:MAG: hypothetical protein HY564_01330 [Candidatus Jacksonbacteria bacterium]|nr:hypothetical protein [Candidatus Jacksonbacteria bacterium]